MTGASLAVAMIGRAPAQARGLVTKHGIKQVDRLAQQTVASPVSGRASPAGCRIWWGSRGDVVVAMDWTDVLDGDGQVTLALNLVTDHGRAIPLLWLSVWKDELKRPAQRRRGYLSSAPVVGDPALTAG